MVPVYVRNYCLHVADLLTATMFLLFFFSSRRRHTICALVTGVQTCALPIFARTFRFRVERALAPPLPERQHIASVVALNARCTIEQRAVKGGAIIVGQLDQTGFLDEAAQLYEMARALASGHDPSSRIGA